MSKMKDMSNTWMQTTHKFCFYGVRRARATFSRLVTPACPWLLAARNFSSNVFWGHTNFLFIFL